MESFRNFPKEFQEEVLRGVNEINKLYGLSEAEQYLLTNTAMIVSISHTGLSHDLHVKLVKTLAAQVEYIRDMTKKYEKEIKK